MANTFVEARTAIEQRIADQWNADAPAVIGAPSVLLLKESETPAGRPVVPQSSVPAFGRVTIRHSDGDLRAFGDREKRWGRQGQVFVQCFVKYLSPADMEKAIRLGEVALEAFEGKTAGPCWFREVSLLDVGTDGPWYQVNVTARFFWEAVK